MALLNIKLWSETLGLSVTVNVIIQQKRTGNEKFKTLWLLHGMGDNHNAWCRQTSIERYAEGKNLCVIMPSVDTSYYTDMYFGNRYFTYITEELPEILSSMLPISIKREDNYVAGLSMGGYGAFKTALNFPQKYSMAASLSGALDRNYLYENCDELNRTVFKYAYGSKENFVGSINDLLHMAILRKEENNLPELYMCCGTEDFLYDANIRYLNHLKSLDIPVTYEEDSGYAHTWDYWDIKIQRVLKWMKL